MAVRMRRVDERYLGSDSEPGRTSRTVVVNSSPARLTGRDGNVKNDSLMGSLHFPYESEHIEALRHRPIEMWQNHGAAPTFLHSEPKIRRRILFQRPKRFTDQTTRLNYILVRSVRNFVIRHEWVCSIFTQLRKCSTFWGIYRE